MAANGFVGEIRIFAGNFAPETWMLCNGQLLNISQYSTLFGVIGTTYGGDGQTTFALPDLRGRLPLHPGTNAGVTFDQGEMGGTETMTLTTDTMPEHLHALQATTSGFQWSPAGALPAQVFSTQSGVLAYGDDVGEPANLHPETLQPTGGGQPHTNVQPFLCLNFIIATQGALPSQT